MGESAFEERVHAPKAQIAPAQVRPPRPKQFIAPTSLASPAPTGDSKQALQWDAKVATVTTNVGEASLKVRFEVSHRREGETSVRGELGERDGSVRVGELQQVMNREISARGEKFAAKFKTALLAVDYELLQDGTLDLAGVPINIKLDTKALEMDGGSLYAGKLAIVGEGDVSAWIPGPFKTVVQLRLELAIPADVIVKLYESKQAAKAIEKFRAADARFRTADRQLQKTRTYIRRLEERAGKGLSAKDSARLTKYRQELVELQGAKTKLQSLRNTLSVARDRGIKTLERVAEKLNKTPIGRVAMKVATKVVGKILGKLIPIYNIIQTAKDLYEIAKAIGSIDWSNESGGEYNPDGESVEGADAPTDESNEGKQGDGEKQGEGKQVGEGEETDGVPADLQDLSDLEPTDGQLSPVAAQVIGAVQKKSGESSDAAALTPDEIDTLNEIIPADLDADEVARLQTLLQASLSRSGEPQTLAEAVVGAMQSLRPEGIKRTPAAALAHEPVAVGEAARVPKPKKKVRKAKRKRKPKEPAPAKVVDLRAYLFEHVVFDPAARRLSYVSTPFTLEGVVFKIEEAKVTYQLIAGEPDLHAMAYVSVRVVANAHGRSVANQPRSTVKELLLEIFEARSIAGARPQGASAAQRTPE